MWRTREPQRIFGGCSSTADRPSSGPEQHTMCHGVVKMVNNDPGEKGRWQTADESGRRLLQFHRQDAEEARLQKDAEDGRKDQAGSRYVTVHVLAWLLRNMLDQLEIEMLSPKSAEVPHETDSKAT